MTSFGLSQVNARWNSYWKVNTTEACPLYARYLFTKHYVTASRYIGLNHARQKKRKKKRREGRGEASTQGFSMSYSSALALAITEHDHLFITNQQVASTRVM